MSDIIPTGVGTVSSGVGMSNLALAPSTPVVAIPATGNWLTNTLGYVNQAAPVLGGLYSVLANKSNPMAPTYNVQLGAIGATANTTNSLSPFGSVSNALNYADEWLSQSKTLNQATTNVGTGVGSSLSSTISEYKNILIIVVVGVIGFFIFKSLNKK